MADFTKRNLVDDLPDLATRYGYAPDLEARFGREELELEQQGLSYIRLAPGFRVPWGHRHGEQEEVYVVISGSARMKVGDEIVELRRLDAVRVPGATPRGMEAGPDGAEFIVTGAPNTRNADAEMLREFWTD